MWGGAKFVLTNNDSVEQFQHEATILRGYTVAHEVRNYCIRDRLIQWAKWAATQRPPSHDSRLRVLKIAAHVL
jgi:hypothetical protein